MSTETRQLPVRRPDVVLRDGARDSVLAAPARPSYTLNPTARAIWELCDGTTTVHELALALCEVFAVDHDVAAREVAKTLRQLRAADLLEPSDA